MIKRYYNLAKLIKSGKVLIIYGPRRSGKTTLLSDFLSNTNLKYKLDSGDNIQTQQILGSQDFSQIKEYASGYQIIAIDEAQQIPNIGMGLKILVDQIPGLKIIATGSSSFDLSQKVGEPLTGRERTITLFPFSQTELLAEYNKYELKQKLEDFLIFGSYPEIITAKSQKEKVVLLNGLANSYLLKDVFSLEKIKGSKQLLDLLKLVAFQIGNEVSLNELATQVRLDIKTVGRYLDILEKAFVLKKVGGFSRNLRKEISGKAKYYFYDNGIRNAVIAQFNKLDSRDDVGALFENFVVMERLKNNSYKVKPGEVYFWRTYDGQEIDLVEERSGKLFGFEIKWSPKAKEKIPKDWLGKYKNSQYKIINQENYLDFIGVK
ncbi:MAG: ATP-binding protein [Candidatus Gribaldobacteria bacterium]|nr:ATP-binding protein [Candidatus Gribaldobacteria bacterium]